MCDDCNEQIAKYIERVNLLNEARRLGNLIRVQADYMADFLLSGDGDLRNGRIAAQEYKRTTRQADEFRRRQ